MLGRAEQTVSRSRASAQHHPASNSRVPDSYPKAMGHELHGRSHTLPKVEVGTSAGKQLTRKWGRLEVRSRSRVPTTLHVAKLLLQPLASGPLQEAHPSALRGRGVAHPREPPRPLPTRLAARVINGAWWAATALKSLLGHPIQSHSQIIQPEQASKTSPGRPVLLSSICRYFPWTVPSPFFTMFFGQMHDHTHAQL
jgi:hypothetical protein